MLGKFLGGLTKAAFDIATLPIDVLKDVNKSMGGYPTTSNGKTFTRNKIRDIADDLREIDEE